MNRRSFFAWLPLLTLLAASAISCLPWQLQPEGQLVYAGPTEQGIPAGDFLPGTDIQYVGLTDQGAEVLIGGQQAVKKKGDSLDWDGHPLPGVTLNLNQRIVWFTEEKLHAAGTARLALEGTQPVAMPFPEESPALYKLPTTYNVKRGETIPGTTITYVGSSEKGAELSGVEGYPYRKLGDSIVWKGKLRERVFLQLNVRVIFIAEDFIRVAGTAALSLTP